MLALINPFAAPIGRAKWWGLQFLILLLAMIALFAVAFVFSDTGTEGRVPAENMALLAIIVLVIYSNLTTCLARLRDTGRSGWWWLAFNLPFAGTGLMVYFCGGEPGKPREFDIDKFEESLARGNKSQPTVARQEPAPTRSTPMPSSAVPSRPVRLAPGAKPVFGRR